MGIIAVAGRKGGIGKSTIAGNLAGEFSARGAMSRCLMRIRSTAAWAAQGEGTLSKCIERVGSGKGEGLRAHARRVARTADIVVIDTPPGITVDAL